MKRLDNITLINNYVERLITQVKLNNSVGLTDINSAAEDFFADLLNLVFGTNLVNLNLEKLNFPAIDLGDDKKRVCYQVTSTNDKPKIQKTFIK